MRRILLAFMTTVVAVVLLFGYRTSTPGGGALTTAVAAATAGTSGSTGTSGSSGTSGTGTAATTSAAKTYDGAVAQTRWGPVQVQLTVRGGKITAATALQVPTGNGRDEEINSRAVPVLNGEVVAAQSAGIDTVSGATVTSDGYLTSLQSALDAADL